MSAPLGPRSPIADIARQARALLGQVRESRWPGFAPPRVHAARPVSRARPVAAPPRPQGSSGGQPRRAAPPVAAVEHRAASTATNGPGAASHEPSRWGTLEQISQVVGTCTNCALHATRTHTVPGEGAAAARLMFIGEAPGADEDRLGRPFVGAAGQLLDKMIAGMGLAREQVFIANTLKCRPPENRDPLEREVEACLPYLRAQIALIRPAVICSLGRHATHALLERSDPLGELRGRFFDYRGTPLLPTFHPSYLLRTPADKGAAWKDLQKIMRLLGLPLPQQYPTEEKHR